MRALFVSLIVSIALAIAAPPVSADTMTKITEFPPVNGHLGDQAPDGAWIESYDDRTYRFFSSAEMYLNYGEMVVLDVLSYQYQPIIYLRDTQGTVLETGGPIPSWIDAQSQQRVYAAHLEHRSTYQGKLYVQILHSSYHMSVDQAGNPVQSPISNITQGDFYLSGRLWNTNAPAPAAGGGGAGSSDHDCSCQDPGSGRWYDSFLGLCNPPDASTYWCP